MKALWCQLSIWLLLHIQAEAQDSYVGGPYPTYLGGDTPSGVITVAKFPSAHTTGNVYTFTFSQAIFKPNVGPTLPSTPQTACLFLLQSGATASGCTTDGTGTSVAVTIGTDGTVGGVGGLNTLGPGSAGTTVQLVIADPTMFATLPAAFAGGSAANPTMITFTATSDLDTTGVAAAAEFTTVSVPTITLSSPDMNAGTQPTQLVFSGTFPVTMTAHTPPGIIAQIVVSATQNDVARTTLPIFNSGITTGLTASQALGTLTATTYTTADGTTALKDNAGADGTVPPAGTALIINVGSNYAPDRGAITLTMGSALLAVLPNYAGPVCTVIEVINIFGKSRVFDSCHGSQYTTGFGSVLYTPPSTGADPVAKFGGRQFLFELPANRLQTLVKTAEVELLGSVFHGQGPWEQWFNRLVLVPSTGDRFVEIRMKPDLHLQNFSHLARNQLKTLEVIIGYGEPDAPLVTAAIEGFNMRIPENFIGHQILLRRVKRSNPSVKNTQIGQFQRECFDAAGNEMHFYICSAPAEEYYGNQRHLALQFAHLDMTFVEIKNYNKLTGLLPELWGVQPMSEATKATIKKDLSVKSKAQKLAEEANESSIAWAGGGLGAENFTSEDCLSPAEELTAKVDLGLLPGITV